MDTTKLEVEKIQTEKRLEELNLIWKNNSYDDSIKDLLHSQIYHLVKYHTAIVKMIKKLKDNNRR